MNVAAEFYLLPVVDDAEFHVGVEELAEGAAGGTGHVALHGEELFFFVAEGVRFETEEAFKDEQPGS